MSNLDTRTQHIIGFVRAKEDLTEGQYAFLIDYFKSCASRWGCMVHDKDINEKGERESTHFHFVADMLTSKRISTFIREISDALGVSSLAVTISKYVYFEMGYQYLIHKNDKDKYQYDLKNVVDNLDEKDRDLLMAFVPDSFDYAKLCGIIISSSTLSEVICRVGLTTYKMYRNVILDLWGEFSAYHAVYEQEKAKLSENAKS